MQCTGIAHFYICALYMSRFPDESTGQSTGKREPQFGKSKVYALQQLKTGNKRNNNHLKCNLLDVRLKVEQN